MSSLVVRQSVVFLKIPDRDLIQRIDRSLQMSARDMQINRRIFEALMPEQYLDCAQVRSGLQHVRCEAMAQRVRANPFREPCAERCFVTGIPHDLIGEGRSG